MRFDRRNFFIQHFVRSGIGRSESLKIQDGRRPPYRYWRIERG